MKFLQLLSVALCLSVATPAQTNQQIPLTFVNDIRLPAWNYSNYLDESVDSLIPLVWGQGQFYSTVVIELSTTIVLSRLSLYDYNSIFTDKPAYLYAVNGSDTTYLGRFTGEKYRVFVDLPAPFPVVAAKIIMKKFGNNIPQKIKVYGTPYIAGSNADPLPPRLTVNAILPSVNTGMNYLPWLNDTLTNLVASIWTPLNMQSVDVTLPFASRCLVSKVSLYDYVGSWADPALVFLKKDSNLLQIGQFNGYQYKSFVHYLLPAGAQADAIVIRKFGNNIPHKVQAFGNVMLADPLGNTLPPPVVPPPPPPPNPIDTNPSPAYIKIPIEGSRWFVLNYAPNGVSSLFDGITTVKPNTASATFMPTYDCIYPLNDGEAMAIGQVKMYDFQGNFSANPVQLFAIRKNGQRVHLGSFTGTKYMEWVGPYPERALTGPGMFNLDSLITDIQYIGITCTRSDLPTEIEFYGYHTPPTVTGAPHVNAYASFSKTLGMNGFEWDFVRATTNPNARIIAEDKYAAIKNFKGFRNYIDWKQLEGAPGNYYFNPSYAGGWSYDITYERCKRDGIEVLACIQHIPGWMKNTYPANQRADDIAPMPFGFSKDSVQSYIAKSKLGFQFAARYGRNNAVPPSLVSVSNIPRWTGDPINTVKVGLDLVRYIECGNELDKWWRGGTGYMTAYQYAALLSAFYDGHKGALGAAAGVKTADSTMQVVMAGLALGNPSYVRGMIEWCRQNRGYKADGTIDLCWDVINYHHYSNDNGQSQQGVSTRGAAPELSDAVANARAFVEISAKYAGGMPVWITELGFDVHQGSPMKAIAIGSKSVLETQADWTLRSALTYLREGISSLFFYELNDGNVNSATKFASMGLTDTLFKRKPAMDYLYQVNQLMGDYHFNRCLQQLPVIDEYEKEGNFIYAVWVPDEKDTTMNCSIPFANTDSVLLYRPQAGSDSLLIEVLPVVNGAVQLIATETPVFITAGPTPPQQLYVLRRKIAGRPLNGAPK